MISSFCRGDVHYAEREGLGSLSADTSCRNCGCTLPKSLVITTLPPPPVSLPVPTITGIYATVPDIPECAILMEDGSEILLETGDSFIHLEQCGVPTPPPENVILMEDGTPILQEADGSFILVETGSPPNP